MKNYYIILVFLLLTGCGKEFLEKKSNDSLVILATLEDCEALLNDTYNFNLFSSHRLSFVGGDEYYMTDPVYNALPTVYEKQAYIWADDVYGTDTDIDDWDRGYQKILLANLVIDKLRSLTPDMSERDRWNQALGEALFIRAINYYELAQLFCPVYDSGSAKVDLGIPLRLEADITLLPKRSSVYEVYSTIVTDLLEAESLLGIQIENVYTPSRLAAWLLLSKVYLHMEDYEKAKQYSEGLLTQKGGLIDLNTIDVDQNFVFFNEPFLEQDNIEVIYMLYPIVSRTVAVARQNVDTSLLAMYQENDLRKRTFYMKWTSGNVIFKGSYTGAGPGTYFTGLSVNEAYLIAAESNARLSQSEQSLHWINSLLAHRCSSYNFITSLEKNDLLKLIFQERRKELPFRGICWEDLKRLNKESEFERTIYRKVNDVLFTLEPKSAKYVWPFPKLELSLGDF